MNNYPLVKLTKVRSEKYLKPGQVYILVEHSQEIGFKHYFKGYGTTIPKYKSKNVEYQIVGSYLGEIYFGKMVD